jgi:hypothetical protein
MKYITRKSGMSWTIAHSRYRTFAALFLALGLSASGCSQIVDTPSTRSPEPDVRNYYIRLAIPKMEYNYAVTSTSSYYPASATLAMDMQGCVDTFQNIPVYSCLWTYSNNFSTPERWFYSLSATQATELGLEPTQDHYTDSWVELKAPLKLNATWSFMSQGEQITATVKSYGGSAHLEGKTYDDVVMVEYMGSNGTTGTEWFARNTGLIFSHIERPMVGKVENHLLSFEQK